MSEKHGKREKTQTGFTVCELKHFWSYCIKHTFTTLEIDRQTEEKVKSDHVFVSLRLSSNGSVINIFSVVFPSSVMKKETVRVCGVFLTSLVYIAGVTPSTVRTE